MGQEQDTVGGGFISSEIFEGTIYGGRLYDDIRTPDEIADTVHAPVADTSDLALVANWVADPNAATFTDQTGSHALVMSGDVLATWSEGNDTLLGGDGADTIFGGGGDDFIEGGAGDVIVSGGDGNDSIVAGAGADTIDGGAGHDVIELGDDGGAPASDLVDGGDGNDTITSTSTAVGSNDTIRGGAGDDSISVAGGWNELRGDGGNDTIMGGNDEDTIFGGTGDDSLEGRDDADTFIIEDGFGNDTIIGGEGTEGGTDEDVIDLSAMTGPVTVTYTGDEEGTITDGTDTITFSEIERIILTDQDDSLDGAADSASLNVDGGAGNDSLYGGSDDDSIEGGANNDHIEGGDGNDTLEGGDGTDWLFGRQGDDLLRGGEGLDALYAGTGSDTMLGEGGDDLFYIDDTDGTVSIDGGTGTDELRIQTNSDGFDVTFTGDGEGTFDAGTSATTGTFESIERVRGGGGDDTIDASASNASTTLAGGAGNDIITGSNSADPIQGDDGNDTLDGNAGNDTIDGGSGDDLITGGGGDDVFTFNVGDGADTITDFNAGNSGALNDGDTTNNDFVDLSSYYTNLVELRADFDDDGVLNQSTGDFSDNTAMAGGDGLAFSGASRNSFAADNTGVVCFAAGSMILTDHGEVPVQTLRAGDLIQTYDNGLQPLAMISSQRLEKKTLSLRPELKPIELKPGALGAERRLIVSPQHSLLILHAGEERLVRARQLSRLNWSGVREMRGCRRITYYHLAFDAHQLVFANGRLSESFYPGPRAIAALSKDARQKYHALFESAFDRNGIVVDHALLRKVRQPLPYKELPGCIKKDMMSTPEVA